MGVRMFAPIVKVDEARRLVIGRLAHETPDRADEIFDYDGSKPYFKTWSESYQKATAATGQEISFGNCRAMHGKIAAGKFVQMDFNDDDKAIDVAAKVVDDQEWKKVLEGVYTGFSIGGDYVGEKKAVKIDGKTYHKYIGRPSEGSLVDSPCIPSATFFQIHKADGTTMQKNFVQKSEADVIAEHNTRIEKVAHRLARQEFWKLPKAERAALPEDIFAKMSGEEQNKVIAKRLAADNSWQNHVTAAIRLIKAADDGTDENGDDLEKPDDVDQEEWDAMDYAEKLDCIDEYDKVTAAAMTKAADEKELVKPGEVEQGGWDAMSGEQKREAIGAAAVSAAKAAKANALDKAEQTEISKETAPAPAPSPDAATLEKQAKEAGVPDERLDAISELAKLLDNGTMTPETLLALAKGDDKTVVVTVVTPAEVKAEVVEETEMAKWIAQGTLLLKDVPPEEVSATLGKVIGPGAEQVALSFLATLHKVAGLRDKLTDPDIKLVDFRKIAIESVGEDVWKAGGFFEKYVEDQASCIAEILEKAGARHSAVDKGHLQSAHDHLCALGAACSEAEKGTSNGDLFKLAMADAAKIGDIEKVVTGLQAEIKSLKDQPVTPKGVVRFITKGGEQREEAPKKDEQKAIVAKPGEHNEAAAVEAVRKMVASTAEFRKF